MGVLGCSPSRIISGVYSIPANTQQKRCKYQNREVYGEIPCLIMTVYLVYEEPKFMSYRSPCHGGNPGSNPGGTETHGAVV